MTFQKALRVITKRPDEPDVMEEKDAVSLTTPTKDLQKLEKLLQGKAGG
ncbi:hypothetical protein MASR1M31_12160 [Porphyromonadaceae bacterium]